MRDERARKLFAVFAAAGADLRFVGGCVRDAFMGLEPGDLDLATDMLPEAVMATLGDAGIRTIPTGIEHGTVTALLDERRYEITTLRRDVATDGRRATVAFSSSWAEDAARRDFTINALNATSAGLVEDLTDGLADLENHHVRFIGEPEQRIREDVLRILRFFRFHGRFGGAEPDCDALAACTALAHLIPQLSAERIRDELLRILVIDRVMAMLGLMQDAGVLAHCLPVPADLSRLARSREVSGFPKDDALLALRLLLPDDPAVLKAAADRLRLSNREMRRLHQSAEPLPPGLSPQELALAIYRDGQEVVRDRFWLMAAHLPDDERQRILGVIDGYSPRQLPVSGHDLMALGMEAGPGIKQVLHSLEDWWFAHDCPDDQARVLDHARALVAEASG